jgi:hypothetical protein
MSEEEFSRTDGIATVAVEDVQHVSPKRLLASKMVMVSLTILAAFPSGSRAWFQPTGFANVWSGDDVSA